MYVVIFIDRHHRAVRPILVDRVRPPSPYLLSKMLYRHPDNPDDHVKVLKGTERIPDGTRVLGWQDLGRLDRGVWSKMKGEIE